MIRWLPGADGAADRPRQGPDRDLAGRLSTEPDDGPDLFDLPDLPPAWALPQCAQTLRAAGAELCRLPVEVRAGALSRVARSWTDPDDAFRREALDRLPEECGLSADMVGWGLDRAFEGISAQRLLAWWEREGGSDGAPPGLSGHVLAGNVFAAGIPPVVASILAGVPAIMKAPVRAPTFAALLARSFAMHAPELGPCVAAAGWSRADRAATAALLAAVDVVFAFGDDSSIEAITEAAGETHVHGFGHRVSLAVIASDLLDDAPARDAALDGLAVDALAWDGGGCLTPRWVFVEGDAAACEVLARRAAERMPNVVNALPGAPLQAGAGAERAAWLARAAMTGWSASGRGWAVASLEAPRLVPAPPGRALCFLPVPDLGSLPSLLEPLGPSLQGLAWAGDEARRATLVTRLAGTGLSRVVSPGELQRPPIDWNHDDVRILASLR